MIVSRIFFLMSAEKISAVFRVMMSGPSFSGEALPCSAGRQFCRLPKFGYLCFNSYFCLSASSSMAELFYQCSCRKDAEEGRRYTPNSVSL